MLYRYPVTLINRLTFYFANAIFYAKQQTLNHHHPLHLITMEPVIHDIDSDGDTLLILRNPDAPFAVLGSAALWPDHLPDHSSQKMKMSERSLVGSEMALPQSQQNNKEIHLRLSSKHLMFASQYFRKMMTSDWRETKPKEGYSFVVTTEEWDQEALLILMNIIHGQTTEIPRAMSLEMLAKMSALVDYYMCHKAVHFFAQTWIANSTDPVPEIYGREFLLRLCISWVFSEAEIFKKLTETALYQCRGPIHSLGLPIPWEIIGRHHEQLS